MIKPSALALVMLTLTGCAVMEPWRANPRLEDWVAFADRVNGLDAAELVNEYEIFNQRLQEQPGDADRLHLSYLLSRPGLPMQDIGKSQALLAEIGPDSVYAPYRNMLARELVLLLDLQAEQKRVRELHAQLEALKGIDADLSEGQAEIEELSK